ncbi:MAG: hypothetical protein IKE46_10940 [Selenomonadaceae bacterium]|nr:hypothetical protein [Selenomonadaceae bacterium]
MADRSNTADNVVVTGTYENDNLSNTGTMVIIQGLSGNDTITNRANNVTIGGDDGNDYIYNSPSSGWDDPLLNVSITGGAGNDYTESRARNSTIDSGDGHDTVSAGGNQVYVSGGTGNDSINTSGTGVTVYGGDGTDEILTNGSNTYVDGGANNDVIYSDPNPGSYADSHYINVTLNGGAGNDYVYAFRNNYGLLNGNEGDDTIKAHGGDNVSLNGGAGNDSIELANSYYSDLSAVIEFSGEGLDTVSGFNTNDTLQVAGSYATQISDNDVIVSTGAGSIRLTEAANLTSLNIVTVPAGSFGDTTSTTPTTSGGLTTGTNQVLSNYAGEPVTVSGSFMGAAFSGNSFVVNSSAGTLTIQNVTDKVVDLRNSAGGEFIKAYQASSAGVIDGRGINAYEIIQGASNGADIILAGDGGSQLWGGADTAADAIAGGNGSDIFIGGRFQGADAFYNVSSADAVNLTDASLSDIVAAVEVNGNIAIGFNTGNIITIQSTDTLSGAINLADGTSWRYNHATKSWQGA